MNISAAGDAGKDLVLDAGKDLVLDDVDAGQR